MIWSRVTEEGEMFDASKMKCLLLEKGMDAKIVDYFVHALETDEASFEVDEKTRKWALERGFFPGRVELLGLNDDNCSCYLPDFAYFMMHPLNNHFKIWVNDKLTLKYMLDGGDCRKAMPEYYLYIENNGDFTYLMDAPADIVGREDFLLLLLEKKGILAMKPNNGAGGKGFLKLEKTPNGFLLNNIPSSRAEVTSELCQLRNYTVTEYVQQCASLAKFWPESECTLRVIMAKMPRTKCYQVPDWTCLVSYARFGTAASKGASNLSSGGIGVGIDFASGELHDEGFQYKRFSQCGEYRLHRHPDTGLEWDGASIPNWGEVQAIIRATCERLSSLDFLGFDIIVSEDGPKFCEINTMPSLDYEQVICGPILGSEVGRLFFEHHGFSKIDPSDFLNIYRQSSVADGGVS